MKSKYKITIKFWDEHDRLVYLRLPANTSFHFLTGDGGISEDMIDQVYASVNWKGMEPGSLPMLVLPERFGFGHRPAKGVH
jgi:hypothetical protein